MKFLSKLNPFRKQRSYIPDWLTRLFEEYWHAPSSGIVVSHETALTFAAFYSAVDLIARSIAQLPLILYRRMNDDSRQRATDHPVYTLLHTRPNPEQTAYMFRHAMQSWALRYGNAYAEVVRRLDGRPAAIWPIDPRTMVVERDKENRLVYIQGKGTGKERILPAENVIHIRTLGDGLVGKSPVRLFRETIGLGLAAEKAAAGLFGRGFRPSGIITHPGRLSEEAAERLKARLEAAYTGTENFGRVAVLEEGMKFEPLSIPPDDAQFLQTRVHSIRDICRIFHVPPHKLADLADATFSNVEEQNIEYVTDCLGPWLVAWEQELHWKLLLPGERKHYYPEFVVEGLLRGDSKSRAQFYKDLFYIGVLSINDIRRMENLDGIGPAGDRHYVPVNMQPVEGEKKERLYRALKEPKDALPE